jgi:single-strand DNA-binding protein
MSSVNKAIILGRVGRDPEIRYMPNGDAAVNLAIATSEKWKDKNTGAMTESTEWHRVSFFGRQAEVCGEYVRKGDMIYIEGSIKTRKYNDKDGVEKTTTEIRGTSMTMLGGKKDSQPQGQQQTPQQQRPVQQPNRQQAPQRQEAAPANRGSFNDMDDDIPFSDPMKSRAFCLACA